VESLGDFSFCHIELNQFLNEWDSAYSCCLTMFVATN
jgi:hypothetical protein